MSATELAWERIAPVTPVGGGDRGPTLLRAAVTGGWLVALVPYDARELRVWSGLAFVPDAEHAWGTP